MNKLISMIHSLPSRSRRKSAPMSPNWPFAEEFCCRRSASSKHGTPFHYVPPRVVAWRLCPVCAASCVHFDRARQRVAKGSARKAPASPTRYWGRSTFRAQGGNISFIHFSHISPRIWGYFSKFLRSLNSCGSQSQVLSTSFWRGLHFFPLSSAKISIFAGHGGRLGARSARFFKDLGFWAPEISKFLLARRGLRV